MLTLHPDMVLWQEWCFIASMESLIFYLTLVLLVPLSIHCAVKPASAEEDLRNQEEIKEFGKLTLLWESSSYGLNEEFKYTKIPVNIWGLSGLVSSVLFPFPVLTQSWLLMLDNFLQYGSCCICNSIAVWMENIFTYKLLLLQWKLFGSLCGCTVGCSTDQKYWIVIFTNIESLDIVWDLRSLNGVCVDNSGNGMSMLYFIQMRSAPYCQTLMLCLHQISSFTRSGRGMLMSDHMWSGWSASQHSRGKADRSTHCTLLQWKALKKETLSRQETAKNRSRDNRLFHFLGFIMIQLCILL